MMTNRELLALEEAADHPGGWGLFKEASTQKLAAKGYFKRAIHPLYCEQWRITKAGRAALAAEKKED